jgi:hypothetical protein
VIKKEKNKMGGPWSMYGGGEGSKGFGGETRGNGSLGRLMRRWDDNIKMGLQVAGFRDMD